MSAASRTRTWRRIDLVLACLLAIDFGLEAALASGLPGDGRLPTMLAAIPFAAPVAVRRRWPAPALLASVTVLLLQQLLHGQLVTSLPSQSAVFVPLLCAYGVGAWVGAQRGVATLVTSFALLYGVGAIATAQGAAGAPGWVGSISLGFFFLVPAWIVGCLMRERTRRADAFAELERGALAERAQRERTAVAEERAMIGRELQDIIAHSVSVMVVQAGGARRLLGADPERARASILTVEQTGREALAEMRRLLGVLRRDDDPRALTPQPGLAQLPELVSLLRGRGLECHAQVSGLRPRTPGVDLVAYRVVEAALTTAADQGCLRAAVVIAEDRHGLELEIRTDGVELTRCARLDAVVERVALYDGRLDFVVDAGDPLLRCQLPLGATVAA